MPKSWEATVQKPPDVRRGGCVQTGRATCVRARTRRRSSRSIHHDAGRTTAVLVYGVVSIVIALMFNVLWAYAFRHGLIAGTSANAPRVSAARGFIIGQFAYLAATLIALVSPFVSMACFAGLAVYWMLPGRIPSDR